MRRSRNSISTPSLGKKERSKVEDETLWVDPELTFDRLPQPYRFINKILDDIINKCLDCIRFPDAELIKVRNQELHLLQEKKATPCTATTIPSLDNAEFGSISCITTDPSSSYLFIGNTNGGIFMASLNKVDTITGTAHLHTPIIKLSCHCQVPLNADYTSGAPSLLLLAQTDQSLVCFHVTPPPEDSQAFHQVYILELSQHPNPSFAVSKDGCSLSIASQGSVTLYSIIPSTAKGNNPPPVIAIITAPSIADNNGVIMFTPPAVVINTAAPPVTVSSMTSLLKRSTDIISAPSNDKDKQTAATSNPTAGKGRKSKTQPAAVSKVSSYGFTSPPMEVKVMWCYNDKLAQHSMLLSWSGLNYMARILMSAVPKVAQEWYLPTPLTCAGLDRASSMCPQVEASTLVGTGHKEGAVMVWDLHTGAAVQSFSRHRCDIVAISFYKSNMAVTVDKEHSIKVHDIVMNTQLAHINSKIATPQAWMMAQDVPLMITRQGQGEDKIIVSNLQGGVVGRLVTDDETYKIRVGDVDQSKSLAVMGGCRVFVVGSVVVKKESKEEKSVQPKRKGKEGGAVKGKLNDSQVVPKSEVIETVIVYNLKDTSPLDLYASQQK